MSVFISNSCICCNACFKKCSFGAISTHKENPVDSHSYYVDPSKCTECIGKSDSPECYDVCPTVGCIVWDLPFKNEYSEWFSDPEKYGILSFEKEMPHFTEIPVSDRQSRVADAVV